MLFFQATMLLNTPHAHFHHIVTYRLVTAAPLIDAAFLYAYSDAFDAAYLIRLSTCHSLLPLLPYATAFSLRLPATLDGHATFNISPIIRYAYAPFSPAATWLPDGQAIVCRC